MPEGLWIAIAPPYVSGLLFSFLLEQLLRPRPVFFWRRPLSAITLHIGLVTFLFAAEFILFWRPWFAMANVLALLLFLFLVGNAKFQALREPFIYQDFEYVTDALKHPRLYLPFLGTGRTLLAITVILGAIFLGMLLEAPVNQELLAISLGWLLALGTGSIYLGTRMSTSVIGDDPCEDVTRQGQLACLWLYAREERRQRSAVLPSNKLFLKTAPDVDEREFPDLVVVQSESFFDPRRCFSGIRPGILAEYDRMKGSAAAWGRLNVPAWGANTVRTEYSFLAGLNPKTLGIHRFNPYRWIARQGIPTLANYLNARGYKTICIHPYSASFYYRDTVYPLMGFDEFIDILGFQGSTYVGPYVGDEAVASKVNDILEENRQQMDSPPLFIFVITMENHGPLHLEKLHAGDIEKFHTVSPPAGCEELTVYLRHLSHADHMIGLIRNTLEQSDRPGWFCFFGDHLPIMTDVYQALGQPAGDSDYLLWSNSGRNELTEQRDMKIESLAELFIKKAQPDGSEIF